MLLTFLRAIWCLRNSRTFSLLFWNVKKKKAKAVRRDPCLYADQPLLPKGISTGSDGLFINLLLIPAGQYFLWHSPWQPLPLLSLWDRETGGGKIIKLTLQSGLLRSPAWAGCIRIANSRLPCDAGGSHELQLSWSQWFVSLCICTHVAMRDLSGQASSFPPHLLVNRKSKCTRQHWGPEPGCRTPQAGNKEYVTLIAAQVSLHTSEIYHVSFE